MISIARQLNATLLDRLLGSLEQPDWHTPDLERWTTVLHRQIVSKSSSVVLVAHSFGCLAAARVVGELADRISAALLVAPADPVHFGVEDKDVLSGLPVPTTVVGSRNDPWMSGDRACEFADRWSSRFVDLGSAGHINVASGHGPWPRALALLSELAGTNSTKVRTFAREQEFTI